MMHPKNHIIVILAFVTLFCAALACNIDQTEERTNLFYHYYSIEPESLLDALDAGNVDAFSPIEEEPPSIPPDQQMLVPWTQSDYFRIANALYKFGWGETLDGWQLNSMHFALGCEKFNIGFQEGNFEFFKIAKTDERETRLQLIINIRPRGKYVFITENEYYPKLVEWASIDLGQAPLSASEVLQIAENAGGQEKRLSVENACSISMWLSPDSASYNGWEVNYTHRDDRTSVFRVQIDPYTGETH